MWFSVKCHDYNETFFFALSCDTERDENDENDYYKWHQHRKAFSEDILDAVIFDLLRLNIIIVLNHWLSKIDLTEQS